MSSSCRPEETYKPNRNAKEKEISTVENPVGVLIFLLEETSLCFQV